MTLYILVQSLKQFYFARHKYGLENVVWITTSPAIQNFFENNKKNVVLTGGCALNVIFNQRLKEVLNQK